MIFYKKKKSVTVFCCKWTKEIMMALNVMYVVVKSIRYLVCMPSFWVILFGKLKLFHDFFKDDQK